MFIKYADRLTQFTLKEKNYLKCFISTRLKRIQTTDAKVRAE